MPPKHRWETHSSQCDCDAKEFHPTPKKKPDPRITEVGMQFIERNRILYIPKKQSPSCSAWSQLVKAWPLELPRSRRDWQTDEALPCPKNFTAHNIPSCAAKTVSHAATIPIEKWLHVTQGV